MKFIPTSICAVVLSLACASFASAGETIAYKSEAPVVRDFPFEHGAKEFQLSVGPMFSLTHEGATRPRFDDVTLSARIGYMVNTPSGGGPLRGNFEVLGELFGSGIYDGPGDVIIGASLLFRYNFVQPQAKLVPYFQIGGGGAYSNAASADSVQRILGSDFSFNLQGALGLRYMCSDRCSISLEALYRHISNADLADRNVGVNQLGGLLGVSWFF